MSQIPSGESPPVDLTSATSPLSAPTTNLVGTTTPKPRHSPSVRNFPSHLHDFYYFSTLATLHEPHTFCEAYFGLLLHQVMKK